MTTCWWENNNRYIIELISLLGHYVQRGASIRTLTGLHCSQFDAVGSAYAALEDPFTGATNNWNNSCFARLYVYALVNTRISRVMSRVADGCYRHRHYTSGNHTSHERVSMDHPLIMVGTLSFDESTA